MLSDLVRIGWSCLRLQWEIKWDIPTIFLLGLVILGLTWLLWRKWSFTVLLYLRPEEPEDLPYCIPCTSFLYSVVFPGWHCFDIDFGEQIFFHWKGQWFKWVNQAMPQVSSKIPIGLCVMACKLSDSVSWSCNRDLASSADGFVGSILEEPGNYSQ